MYHYAVPHLGQMRPPYLGPEGGRLGGPTQAVGHTCSGNLGIVKILKLHHISKNPS